MKKSDESMVNQNHYYNHGNNTKIAFVFSVPGKLELYNNRPVVGETGVLLEDLMLLLEDEFFPLYDKTRKNNRYDYRITNAWNESLYIAKDNKTEAANKDILNKNNTSRLHKELEDISDIIFVFGDKAKLAIKSLNLECVKIVYTRHLGLMSINQIKNDINDVPLIKGDKGNTNKRLEVVVKDVLNQVKKSK